MVLKFHSIDKKDNLIKLKNDKIILGIELGNKDFVEVKANIEKVKSTYIECYNTVKSIIGVIPKTVKSIDDMKTFISTLPKEKVSLLMDVKYKLEKLTLTNNKEEFSYMDGNIVFDNSFFISTIDLSSYFNSEKVSKLSICSLKTSFSYLSNASNNLISNILNNNTHNFITDSYDNKNISLIFSNKYWKRNKSLIFAIKRAVLT